MRPYCVFCNIVAGTESGTIIYQDDEIIVIRNILRWVPVMLLAMTKKHTTQDELWAGYMGKIAPIAAEIGRELCPNGFRLLSNFGYDAGPEPGTRARPHPGRDIPRPLRGLTAAR